MLFDPSSSKNQVNWSLAELRDFRCFSKPNIAPQSIALVPPRNQNRGVAPDLIRMSSIVYEEALLSFLTSGNEAIDTLQLLKYRNEKNEPRVLEIDAVLRRGSRPTAFIEIKMTGKVSAALSFGASQLEKRIAIASMLYSNLAGLLIIIDAQRFSPEIEKPPVVHVTLSQLKDLTSQVNPRPRFIAVAIDIEALFPLINYDHFKGAEFLDRLGQAYFDRWCRQHG